MPTAIHPARRSPHNATTYHRDLDADVVAFNRGRGGADAVFIGESSGAAFSPSTRVIIHFCTATETCPSAT